MAFPASVLLQLSRQPQNEAQNWILGIVANGLLSGRYLTLSLTDRIRLFVHYTISTSSLSLCKLIWWHWTDKMPVRYVLSSVWVRLSIFSQLSIIQYMGLCVFSLHISLVMIEGIYILCLIIINKSDVWTVSHCLDPGHETMVYIVCLSILLSLFDIQTPLIYQPLRRGQTI